MPFQVKVQPVDAEGVAAARIDAAAKPAGKSRLKRLFERQFPGVLKTSSSSIDKLAGAGDGKEKERDLGVAGDIEPSSVCLSRMVLGFIEEDHNNEKPSRGRCNCFNGHFDDISDDEIDLRTAGDGPVVSLPVDAVDAIKGLVMCVSVYERNLLADASKLVSEKAKNSKGKKDCRKFVVDGLISLGYDASVCKSRWEKNSSFSAGEYEYIDVIIAGGDRLIVDVDFRSEFEVARSTKAYRAVLQNLPVVFIGKPDRLRQIVSIVAEAGRQSLTKKGLHVPPWRKPEYMRAKWLSPYQRTTAMAEVKEESVSGGPKSSDIVVSSTVPYEFEFRFEDSSRDGDNKYAGNVAGKDAAEERTTVSVLPWGSPSARPKAGEKFVAGLAALCACIKRAISGTCDGCSWGCRGFGSGVSLISFEETDDERSNAKTHA